MISRSTQAIALALAWTVGVTVVLTFLILGAPEASPVGLPDPGPLVAWGIPISRALVDVLSMATVGFFMVAVFLLPNGQKLEGLSIQAVRIASRFSWAWLLFAVVYYLVTVADIYGLPLWRLAPAQLWYFVAEFSNGRALLIQLILLLVIALWSSWSFNTAHVAILCGLSVGAIAPIALTGHAAAAGPHMLAVSSLLLHMVGAILWVGGLIALCWVGIRGSKRLDAAVSRYSALAIWCFVFVAVSGLVSGLSRITTIGDLSSRYGFMLGLKLLALIVLGAFGYFQRRRIINNGGSFLKLALCEVAVMLTTVAIAVVLARTPLPAGDERYIGKVEVLLSGSIPPEPTLARIMWGWEPNGFGLLVVGLGSVFYLYGVIALRRRGDSWPIARTLSWFFGLLIVGWVTFGGLGDYSAVMFSLHMISHMFLAMIAPIFLVLAAPMTLALRTLPGPRVPGEYSPRKMLNDLLHSKLSRFYTNPGVASVIFIGSLFAVYFTGLFDFLMDSHLGHAAMEFHFLFSGFLFYYVVVGVDPSPRQLQPVWRMLVIMIVLPFHAFFSVALMSSIAIVGENYYRMIDRPYATDLLVDQNFGASVSWAMGEIPMVIVVGAIFWQWFQSDQREARRKDRAAQRDNDAELEQYNAYLKALADKDGN